MENKLPTLEESKKRKINGSDKSNKPEWKEGDEVHVKDVNGKDRDGYITSVNNVTEMAQVDFGGGDKYGITFSRLEKSANEAKKKT